MTIKFRVNDGPELLSRTMNLTERSLAIQSAADVQKGDVVVARLESLPAIEGEVVRVWDEGFAITLGRSSCALVALAHSCAEKRRAMATLNPARDEDAERIGGAVFPLADIPEGWCRFVSFRTEGDQVYPHRMTIILKRPLPIRQVKSVWLSIHDARWIARIARTHERNDAIFITATINSWQLHMAKQYDLDIAVVFDDFSEVHAIAPAEYIERHLDSLTAQTPKRMTA